MPRTEYRHASQTIHGGGGRWIVAGAIGGCVSSFQPTVKATDAAAWSAARASRPCGSARSRTLSAAAAAALFLHGFPLSSFQWRGAFDRLADERRRCVAADFLGLGFTEVAPGQSCAPNAQVEMLAALLDSLSISTVDLSPTTAAVPSRSCSSCAIRSAFARCC